MKNDELDRKAAKRLFRGKLLTVVGCALALAALVTLVLLVWQKGNQQADTSDFDGTVVDRLADYTESLQGSLPRFRLSVEADDGKRFIVKVDPSVYESAKVGMRIKRRAGQIVLIDTEGKNPGK